MVSTQIKDPIKEKPSNEYYAGGEKSGVAIQAPESENSSDLVNDIMKLAQELFGLI